jgi:pimeloyl-ACP methyl ester carboxylesterase
MKELFIKIEDAYVRLHEWGYKEKPTIVCFHGLGSTSLSFIEIGNMISNKYHVISIDLPGHGKTDKFTNEEDYEMPNLIKWIDKVISNVTEDKFFILTHSWGADIALHYMVQYPSKVKKTLLLDGGYYLKSEKYVYEASRGESIDSLQKEIDYYIKDFDEYCFDSLEEHINVEKSNYSRWSHLLEEAANDLIRIENGAYKYHANSFTAIGAVKSMYYYPPDSIYDKMPNTICLLQSTQPEHMTEIRDIFAEKFETGTCAQVKKIDEASHMLHWDKPCEVVEEIFKWFR